LPKAAEGLEAEGGLGGCLEEFDAQALPRLSDQTGAAPACAGAPRADFEAPRAIGLKENLGIGLELLAKRLFVEARPVGQELEGAGRQVTKNRLDRVGKAEGIRIFSAPLECPGSAFALQVSRLPGISHKRQHTPKISGKHLAA